MKRLICLCAVLVLCLTAAIPLWPQSSTTQWTNLDAAAAVGIVHPQGMTATAASLQVAGAAKAGLNPTTFHNWGSFAGSMLPNAALSAAVMTTRSGPFSDVVTMGDWDGREDLVADHQGKVDDFSAKIPAGTTGFTLTRAAQSEHTIANGFTENIFYYGDSLGNVYVASTTNLAQTSPAPVVTVLNMPTILNAFGTLNSDDQVVITGLCVNPVADLSSFPNVNGAFAPFNGLTGEILYVTFWDTGGGMRTLGSGTTVHSGLLAFPIADVVSPAAAPPGVLSAAAFPVTVGGSFGVEFSSFANLAGCAVDDDSAVYLQQVDLVGLTGGNIVKIAPAGTNQDRSLATSGFFTTTTLNPPGGNYGTISGPSSQVDRVTNYSGTSTTFGNIAALAAGPDNTLYAAVSRSKLAGFQFPATLATEGLFTNPPALGNTPSMIISFSDFAVPIGGGLPVHTGFAGVVDPALPALVPGVNNFQVFVEGTGPDLRAGTKRCLVSSPEFGNLCNTLQVDFQVDYTIYSGLAVDEARNVYVISGGTPMGVGRNPSPNLGEMMIFTDELPADRRADYVDLRTDGTLPTNDTPPANVGDGKSDRWDHIFVQAPMDPQTLAPSGMSGLASGFLMYLNRTRNNAAVFTTLPNGSTQALDTPSGPVNFNDFDPSEQVAGGDLVTVPFTHVDYEFLFGANVASACTSPWTAFYLNPDGNITFGAGDATVPTNADLDDLVENFLEGPPKIAPAWAALNPASRTTNQNTFPVQALGFAGVNNFKIRWINVPENGFEASGSRNSFSVYLFDDGSGTYDSAPRTKGPTALRFTPTTVVGHPARPIGSAFFDLQYGRMDLVGTNPRPEDAGYSIGGLTATAALSSNLSKLSNSGGSLIGNNTQSALFEAFSSGSFDLREGGSTPAVSKPSGQTDNNREFLNFVGKSCQTIVLP